MTLPTRAPTRTLAATLAFVSAGLLFTAQPAAARTILPWLGGGPVAWGATLLFFQVTLLAGYVAVDLGQRRGVRSLGVAYLGLLVAGTTVLMVQPPFGGPPGLHDATLPAALGQLATSLGLPVLALSLTAPAVQARVAADTGDGDRRAYHLYAASNAGSLLGLVGYPLLVEPAMPLSLQWRAWSMGFLVVTAVAAALWVPLLRRPLPPPGVATAGIGLGVRLAWVVRAALPAVLLASVTEYLTRDIAPIPLLWVVPLALYLATWILAFAPGGGGLVRLATGSQDVVAVAAAVVLLNQPYALLGPAVALTALVVVGLAQHGALAASAPHTSAVGRFYVFLALGGAAGTAIVVAVSPLLLPLPIEGPLALAAAVSLGASNTRGGTRASRLRFLVFAGLAAAAPLLLTPTRTGILASATLLAGALAMCWRSRPRWVGLVLAALALFDTAIRLSDPERIGADSSVLGRFAVRRDARGTRLVSGSTLHGLEPPTSAAARPLAALYYTRNGPFGDLVHAAEATTPRMLLGVVGLGIGSLACTAAPGAEVTFFELNPGVVRLARDTSLFVSLSRCAPEARVLVGDARLTLEGVRERYDLLVIDAFSSDAIPTHLLTREAFALYRRRTTPRGIVAYHVSNRFLDLEPQLGALAAEAGWAAVRSVDVHRPTDPAAGPPAEAVTVIAMAADSAGLRGLVDRGYWRWAAGSGRAWTDEWAPLASALRLTRASLIGK